jgi:hypothetical protein
MQGIEVTLERAEASRTDTRDALAG